VCVEFLIIVNALLIPSETVAILSETVATLSETVATLSETVATLSETGNTQNSEKTAYRTKEPSSLTRNTILPKNTSNQQRT